MCCSGLLFQDTWYHPCRPGIKLVSSALAGGCFTTGLSGSATKEVPLRKSHDLSTRILVYLSFNWGVMYVTVTAKIWHPQPITDYLKTRRQFSKLILDLLRRSDAGPRGALPGLPRPECPAQNGACFSQSPAFPSGCTVAGPLQ